MPTGELQKLLDELLSQRQSIIDTAQGAIQSLDMTINLIRDKIAKAAQQGQDEQKHTGGTE